MKLPPGCEEAFRYGRATIKFDGSCCAIIGGVFYKRFDAKKGKSVPEGAIPCCDPDPITGHWPHWVKVDPNNPADKWFVEAHNNTFRGSRGLTGTFEAVGPHFQGNPHLVDLDLLLIHGVYDVEVDRDYQSIKKYLETSNCEGLVFWLNGEPVCKIKKTDFGFPWPVKGEKKE